MVRAVKRRRWLLAIILSALILLVLAVTAAIFFPGRDGDPQPVQPAATTDQALPAGVEYEFVWPDGAARGIDLPREIYIPSSGRRVPLTGIGDLRSEPDEDKVAFLQRVRKEMVAYSDRQTFEACALICSNGEAEYSVRMITVGAVAHCAIAPICLPGHATTRQSIHSHCPDRPRLRATMADEFLSGGSMARRSYLPRCDPDSFSSLDMDGWAPGWLAGVRALYRHDGPHRITSYE